jgi:hypothetical protein
MTAFVWQDAWVLLAVTCLRTIVSLHGAIVIC